MKLGIYMGSFNPPHIGHEKVINYLLENKVVDKIIVIPTLNYWHKQDLIDIKDRINMLKYLEKDNIIIDEYDYKYIYTIELLEVLKRKYPNDELLPIIGADNLINFHKWKNYQELLKYQFIVMNRDDMDIYPLVEKLNCNNFILIDNFPSTQISSTQLRNNLDSNYLHPKVLQYIKNKHLYNN